MRLFRQVDVGETLRMLRKALATTLALGALVFALYAAEREILSVLKLTLPEELAVAAFLATFGFASLAFSYTLARTVYRAGALASTAVAKASPKLRPLASLVRIVFAAAALLTFIATLLNLLSLEVSAVAGVAQWLSSTLGSFFSVLLALILALQMKEIVGNYLAWLIIKFGDLVEEGDYISFSGEFLKVVRVGYSHTLLVNAFEEEVYLPNLKFLLETYRKPFSRRVRRYIEVCFTLPYSYPYEEVAARVHKALQNLNNPQVSIASHTLLVKELQPYAVAYELRVKPGRPMFPSILVSEVIRALLKEFGEALSTPALVVLTDASGGRGPASTPESR